MSKDKEYKYARINVIFNNNTFHSMWLELVDDELTLIKTIFGHIHSTNFRIWN